MSKFTFFEYTNTSGGVFRVAFNNKEEQRAAWIKMWNYYNSPKRMHPLREMLKIYPGPNYSYSDWELYIKAKKKDIGAIKKLLNKMWDNGGLFSFYGKKISVNK